MGSSKILFDSVIENGSPKIYASSQTGAIVTDVNRDHWSGSARPYPTGTYKGYDSVAVRLKITNSADYNEAISNVVPTPTAAVYASGNTGDGSVALQTYGTWPAGTHGGIKMILTRNVDNQWDVDYYTGLDPTTKIEFTTDGTNDYIYSPSGNNYFRILTSEGDNRFELGDTITFYCYQAECKISTNGGAVYGDAEDMHTGGTTWCGYDFEKELTNGLSIRIVLNKINRAFNTDDYCDLTAGYEHGIDQLVSQPRTDLWQSKRGGYQCIFIDAGTSRDADIMAVLDRLGTVTLWTDSTAAVIGSCTGELASVGSSCNLTIDGDAWSDSINGGILWICSGAAMGRYYNISGVSDPAVTLSDDPADDGAVIGDRYLILPGSASNISFSTDSSSDIKLFNSTESARGWWVRFYSASLTQLTASKIRIGETLSPDIAPVHMQERTGTPNDAPSISVTGVIDTRAVGYMGDNYPIYYDLITPDDRDDIWEALSTYISPTYSRFMLFIPNIAVVSGYQYGRVKNPKTTDENNLWSTFSCELDLSAHA